MIKEIDAAVFLKNKAYNKWDLALCFPSSIRGIIGSYNNVVKGQSISISRETAQERKSVSKSCRKITELLAKLKVCYMCESVSVCVFI